MNTNSNFKPTVLIIKQHKKTGLKYFHKTTRLKLIESYSGSGVYWTKHLKKHGNDWINIWVSDIFYDKHDLIDFALLFSELFDITNDANWANLVPENGIDGVSVGNIVTDKTKHKMSMSRKGKPHTEEWNQKMAESKRGSKHSEETKRKISESHKNNPKCFHTEETKRKISNARKKQPGRPQTEETKRKISESRKNIPR